MSKLTSIIGLVLLGSALNAAEISFQAADVQIDDGDTIIIPIDGKPVSIQLLGIDAPEDKENPKLLLDIKRTGLQREQLTALGKAATEHLDRLIKVSGSLLIDVENAHKDRYGRLNAMVKDTKGGTLNQAMVADGYAIGLLTGTPDLDKALGKLQQEAKANKRGLWTEAVMESWAGAQ